MSAGGGERMVKCRLSGARTRLAPGIRTDSVATVTASDTSHYTIRNSGGRMQGLMVNLPIKEMPRRGWRLSVRSRLAQSSTECATTYRTVGAARVVPPRRAIRLQRPRGDAEQQSQRTRAKQHVAVTADSGHSSPALLEPSTMATVSMRRLVLLAVVGRAATTALWSLSVGATTKHGTPRRAPAPASEPPPPSARHVRHRSRTMRATPSGPSSAPHAASCASGGSGRRRPRAAEAEGEGRAQGGHNLEPMWRVLLGDNDDVHTWDYVVIAAVETRRRQDCAPSARKSGAHGDHDAGALAGRRHDHGEVGVEAARRRLLRSMRAARANYGFATRRFPARRVAEDVSACARGRSSESRARRGHRAASRRELRGGAHETRGTPRRRVALIDRACVAGRATSRASRSDVELAPLEHLESSSDEIAGSATRRASRRRWRRRAQCSAHAAASARSPSTLTTAACTMSHARTHRPAVAVVVEDGEATTATAVGGHSAIPKTRRPALCGATLRAAPTATARRRLALLGMERRRKREAT